jgi:hypothetical protein
MLRNVLRWSLLTAFDMTAGLAFVAGVVSCWALVEVVRAGPSPIEDFRNNSLLWIVIFGVAMGWIYYFSIIRDRVRARILKSI